MKAKSCFSTSMDPYRAGIELGEALAPVEPEVVFLFPSIHYDGSAELTEALYEVLGNDELIIIGSTGDGFYEIERVGDAGVSALGIRGGGRLRFHLASVDGVRADPAAATARCVEAVNAMCSAPASLYFLASSLDTNVTGVIPALREHVTGPVVGGLAGDDYSLERSFVYIQREVKTDAIALLAVEGPAVFDIRVAQQQLPRGRPGTVTATDGTTVTAIDGIPSMDFLERELGKPLTVVDEGTITFKLTKSGGREERIRALYLPEEGEDDVRLRLTGGVEEGDRAQVCLAAPELLVDDVRSLGASLETLPFDPVAGIIVSCAGRKRVLGGGVANEVEDIVKYAPTLQGLVGFPSFGEFGPLKEENGYSRALFHNMTYILLLLGESQAESVG